MLHAAYIQGSSRLVNLQIQNNYFEKIAHAIQRETAFCSSHCRFYGLMADGTTNISTTDSCSLKYVDSSFEPYIVFGGFLNVWDSTGET